MMKHLFILLLIGYLFISLAPCKQHRPYDDQLVHIDSLADGKQVAVVPSALGNVTVPVESDRVYLVKVGTRTFKLAL